MEIHLLLIGRCCAEKEHQHDLKGGKKSILKSQKGKTRILQRCPCAKQGALQQYSDYAGTTCGILCRMCRKTPGKDVSIFVPDYLPKDMWYI